MQIAYTTRPSIARSPPTKRGAVAAAGPHAMLWRQQAAVWQRLGRRALCTAPEVPAVAVEAPSGLSSALPSDLRDALGLASSSKCLCWYESGCPHGRWYVVPRQGDDASCRHLPKGMQRTLCMTTLHTQAVDGALQAGMSRFRDFFGRTGVSPGHVVLVAGLPRATREAAPDVRRRLRQHFSDYSLTDTPAFLDGLTGSALLAFTSQHEASMAARQMHGSLLDGHRLSTSWWDA